MTDSDGLGQLTFFSQLQQFHRRRGVDLQRTPNVNGKPLDLYRLFLSVQKYGGNFEKISQKGKWDELFGELELPRGCHNLATVLQRLYGAWIAPWEKFEAGQQSGLGDERGAGIEADAADDAGLARRRSVGALRVPSTQNLVAPPLHPDFAARPPPPHHLPPHKPADPLHKVCLSLLSGLPNEVDFALNSLLLLSANEKVVVDLRRSPQLLPLLVGHCGLFDDGQSGLSLVASAAWSKGLGRDFRRFWTVAIDDEQTDVLELLDASSDWSEEAARRRSDAMFGLSSRFVAGSRTVSFVSQSVEYHRVVQVLTTVRNLSFFERNAHVLADSELALRLLLLACHSNVATLRSLAADALGNVAKCWPVDAVDSRTVQFLFRYLYDCFFAKAPAGVALNPDRQALNAGLEVMGSLLRLRRNWLFLADELQKHDAPEAAACATPGFDIMALVRQLGLCLLLKDFRLVISALDVLYLLSATRAEALCSVIAKSDACFKCLIYFLTIETAFFGRPALRGIRIFENVPPMPMAPPGHHYYHHAHRMPTHMPMSYAYPVRPPLRAPMGAVLVPPPGTVMRPALMQPSAERAPLKRYTGVEFAHIWIVTNYELTSPWRPLDLMDVYTDYLRTCTQCCQRDVLGVDEFLRCFGRAFLQLPAATLRSGANVSEKPPAGAAYENVLINGLRRRGAPPANGLVVGVPTPDVRYQPAAMNSPTKQPPLQPVAMRPPTDTPAGGFAQPPSASPEDAARPTSRPLLSPSSAFSRVNKRSADGAECDADAGGKRRRLFESEPTSPARPAAVLDVCSGPVSAQQVFLSETDHCQSVIRKVYNRHGTPPDDTDVPDAGRHTYQACCVGPPFVVDGAQPPMVGNMQQQAALVNGILDGLNSHDGRCSPGAVPNGGAAPRPALNHSADAALKKPSAHAPDSNGSLVILGQPATAQPHLLAKAAAQLSSLAATKLPPRPTPPSSPDAAPVAIANVDCALAKVLNVAVVPAASDVLQPDSARVGPKALTNGELASGKESPVPHQLVNGTSPLANGQPTNHQRPCDDGRCGTPTEPPLVRLARCSGGDTSLKKTAILNAAVESMNGCVQQRLHAAADAAASGGAFACEWRSCQASFGTLAALTSHVSVHCAVGHNGPLVCLWRGCEPYGRQKYSLLSHLVGEHCAASKLAGVLQRRQAASGGRLATPVTYPADAAAQAVRRFDVARPFKELMDPGEGPVTKHLRLGAGLVLRNVAQASPLGRLRLRRFESLLADLAFSQTDVGRVCAEVLAALARYS